jgi:hypothetical protein
MYIFLIALLVTEMILAFICGPHSCEWGNGVYFYTGIIIVLVAFALPLFHIQWPIPKRIGFGFLFLLSGVVVWAIGFMAGGFRIICRLI